MKRYPGDIKKKINFNDYIFDYMIYEKQIYF